EVALSATYPQTGDNLVGKIQFDGKKVWINDTQYFDNVSQTAWNFYIGGYQPAQKWLKDRKERALSRTDVLHYM
ncbi:type ISP restriction/modification enzyme, partial [Streptococcus pneumoniae]